MLYSATLVTAFYHPRVECRVNLMTQAALCGEWNYVSCSRIPSIHHCTRGDRANIFMLKWLLCFRDLLQSGVSNIWTIYIYVCISNWGLLQAIFEIVSSDLFKGYELIWGNFLKQAIWRLKSLELLNFKEMLSVFREWIENSIS